MLLGLTVSLTPMSPRLLSSSFPDSYTLFVCGFMTTVLRGLGKKEAASHALVIF